MLIAGIVIQMAVRKIQENRQKSRERATDPEGAMARQGEQTKRRGLLSGMARASFGDKEKPIEAADNVSIPLAGGAGAAVAGPIGGAVASATPQLAAGAERVSAAIDKKAAGVKSLRDAFTPGEAFRSGAIRSGPVASLARGIGRIGDPSQEEQDELAERADLERRSELQGIIGDLGLDGGIRRR